MAENNLQIAPIGWTSASILSNSVGDAIDNIFDVLVKWPWEGTVSSGSLIDNSEAAVSYRCASFEPPTPEAHTTKKTWHGVEVSKPAAGVKLDRTFTLEFSLDANYALYQKWITWQKFAVDVNTSGSANTATALGTIQVIAPGSEYSAMSWSTPTSGSNTDEQALINTSLGASELVWTFEDCWVSKVGQPKFENKAEGGSIKYQVTVFFGDCAYPFYTAANAVTHSHKS